MRIPIAALILLLAAAVARAEQPNLAFRPGEKGYYTFDTGLLRGQMRLDGRSQGICSLVHVPSGQELAKVPGLLSYYRILVTDGRYGHAARDWLNRPEILADGRLQVVFPPAEEHPLTLTGVFQWKTPNTLDLETSLTPNRDMPQLELFLSSYFAKTFDALVFVKANMYHKDGPTLLRADDNPLVDGTYLMFPRDREAVGRIFDGRWNYPPNPVQWSVTRWLAGPMALRRDAATGLTAVLMSPPEDCFAVATPYNKTPPDGVAGHSSLYLSLLGRDVKAGETVHAHCRMVIDSDLSDARAGELYQAYLKERQPSAASPAR
jgi:hypothetical protein